MKLVIDAGNSSLKIGVFKEEEMISFSRIAYNDIQFEERFNDFLSSKYTRIIYCSVAEVDFKKYFFKVSAPVTQITNGSIFPFQNNYKTPKTLGVDRLAACTGALFLSKNSPFLVIDIGTCITYDYVDNENVYQGGPISPGITLRSKSMHNYTAKLPLVNLSLDKFDTSGMSTKNALKAGIKKGISFELNGFISEYKNQNPSLKVFLTGGDAIFFEDALKNSIFAVENLNLIGLNQLLLLNE